LRGCSLQPRASYCNRTARRDALGPTGLDIGPVPAVAPQTTTSARRGGNEFVRLDETR